MQDAKSSEEEKRCEEKLRNCCDQWVSRWQHQNTLMWSRLQTMSVLQAAVAGGWYPLINANSQRAHFFSLVVALIGVILSIALHHLIRRDDEWRNKCMREAKKSGAVAFDAEGVRGKSGVETITGISGFFIALNVILAMFSVLEFYPELQK